MTTPGIRFGAAYYHEYQPTPRLAEDMRLMKEAGFTVIRVGESVWSTWEPEPGVFHLDWLEEVLDAAHEHGIDVILGTPTYAIPMWMKRLHPEVAGDAATGQPMHWGRRQEMDFTNPAFLFYAERVIRKIVERYREHPAVIGYQVDNEPGITLLYNEGIFQRFTDSLRHQYGDVETLNREWGLVYWSHRLSTWADLWRPDGNFQPQYDLAWRRFQASLVTEYIGWQADIVREYAIGEQFVTTCIAFDQPGVDDVALSSRLDVVSGNAYYEMEDSLALPDTAPRKGEWWTNGLWSIYDLADRMYSAKEAPFLITETNSSSMGLSSHNYSPYDGQWRQAAWALVARGARMVEYWHWHTLHFGAETYWGGVLPHSQKPGRHYREVAQIGADFAAAGAAVADSTPDSDVAFLYDTDSRFALGGPQSPFRNGGQYFDPQGYHRITSAFYRGAFDAGLQVRLVRPTQLFSSRGGEGVDAGEFAARHPVLIAPAFFTAADADLDWLAAYAEAGGHLVLGPRSAYADREGRARLEEKPARLAEAAGTWYDEIANLPEPLDVSAENEFPLLDGAAATDWMDGLTLTDGTSLVRFVHPHYGRWSAVTTREHGAGRVTVVGTVPNLALAESVARWAADPIVDRASVPETVTVTTSTDSSGRRIYYVHNWSWEPASFTPPEAVTDLIDGTDLAAGAALALGPWDVRVVRTLAPVASVAS
ncbi:beta-galactosidase [Agromyces atrinae]|uniref:beta-galactosidase n=1 Tax=Agromyces atrinae TaxID=592376 RepID=UPI001F55CF35|nr:beta-galactosidase [Agromyces atrinae]MCI2959488.1 beta-galactosidase [Agromyces atrinae]